MINTIIISFYNFSVNSIFYNYLKYIFDYKNFNKNVKK